MASSRDSTAQVIKKVGPYIENPDFTPKMIEKASVACKAICMRVAASRRVVVSSLPWMASCPSHDDVDRFFFEFELIPRCSAQVRAALVQGPLRHGRRPRAGFKRHGATVRKLERLFYVLRVHERADSASKVNLNFGTTASS